MRIPIRMSSRSRTSKEVLRGIHELRSRIMRVVEDAGGVVISCDDVDDRRMVSFMTDDGLVGCFCYPVNSWRRRSVAGLEAAARRAVLMVRRQASDMHYSSRRHKSWRAEPGSELARLRQEAHRVLDVFWQFPDDSGKTARRNEVYEWLASRLGIPVAECHMSMFNDEECSRVIDLCKTEHP
jgi:hypothetical protein